MEGIEVSIIFVHAPHVRKTDPKKSALGHCTDKLNCRVAANGDNQSRRRWSKVPSSTGQKLVTLFTLLTVGSLLTRTKVITNGRQNLTVILQCSWCWHARKIWIQEHVYLYMCSFHPFLGCWTWTWNILGIPSVSVQKTGPRYSYCESTRAPLRQACGQL